MAVRPWAAIASPGRHAPNPKGRTDCSIAKSTCAGYLERYIAVCDVIPSGAQCAPRQRKIIRFAGEHSDSLRAACGGCSLDAHCGGCVRPYGSAGADEFTSGVPRSYPRAPSLAALPQQSEIHHRTGRHAPNPKGRTDCSIAKSTCAGYLERYIAVCDVIPSGAQCAPRQRKIIRFAGEHSDSLRAACGGCSLDAHCGGCVRPYGSAGADEFTNGVPRSYLRAPSLAALPQFTLAHPTG